MIRPWHLVCLGALVGALVVLKVGPHGPQLLRAVVLGAVGGVLGTILSMLFRRVKR
jgi:uncharacterized membrane protein